MSILILVFAMMLGGFGEASRVSTQYLVLFDNIIHRVRFAKFLAVLSQEEYDMKVKCLAFEYCYKVCGKFAVFLTFIDVVFAVSIAP